MILNIYEHPWPICYAHCCFHHWVAMFQLPDDDDGEWTCMPSPILQPSRKRCKTLSAPRPVVPKPASQVALPDDDDGSIDLSNAGAGSGSDNGLRALDDSSLTSATNKIPSVVACPYLDLMDLLQNVTPSCEPELRCHLWEIFSAPRVTPAVRALNGRARRSFDLKHFWDLGETGFQRTILQDILLLRPLCLMLSPPCTMVCLLQHSNWGRIKSKDKWLSLQQALALIDWCMWVAKVQIVLGFFFAFEHPEGSLAWTRASAHLRWIQIICCFALGPQHWWW